MKANLFPVSVVREKISGLPPTYRMIIVVVTVVLVIAAFYFLQYQPQAEVLEKLNKQVADEQKKLATLKQAVAEVDKLQKDLAKSEEEFARMLTFLPDQKEIPGLLENVSQVGSEVGLENILFQPQAEKIQEFYAVIPIRLDLVGTYHELGVFLDKVSKLDRILKVESLNLTRQKDSSELQVGCTVTTYRFVEKPPEPAKGAKGSKDKKK